MKAVFLARAGVLMDDGAHATARGARAGLRCGAGVGLRLLSALDYRLIVIEDGGALALDARASKPRRRRDDPPDHAGLAGDGPAAERAWHSTPWTMLADRLDDLLFREQVAMLGFYCCSHGGAAPGQDSQDAIEAAISPAPTVHGAALPQGCACAPPEPGLLLRAAFEHRIDLPGSWLIGASLDLVEAGNRAGCRTLLVDNGTETQWRLGRGRVPTRIAPDLHAAALLIEAEGVRRRPW